MVVLEEDEQAEASDALKYTHYFVHSEHKERENENMQ